jgi:hypothetical protein
MGFESTRSQKTKEFCGATWPSRALKGKEGKGILVAPLMPLKTPIVDGKMKVDYKLRDGVVTKSNAIEGMRLIGLKI